MERVRPEARGPESCLLEHFQARDVGGSGIQLLDLANKNTRGSVKFDFQTEQVKIF